MCLNEQPIDPETLLTPQFVRALVRRVTARTGSPIFDEDLTQDALLRALMAVRRGAFINHPRAFFEKIVSDVVRDYFRRSQVDTPFVDAHQIRLSPKFEEQIDQARRLAQLQHVMSSLPKPARMVMELFYVKDVPIGSIAEHLKCSRSAVKMTLVRSRKRLLRLYKIHRLHR